MIKAFLTLMAIAAFWTTSEAQTIDSRKILGSYRFSHDGRALNLREMSKMMESNPQAYSIMQKARSNHKVAMIFALAGGGAIGYSLSSVIGGQRGGWPLSGIGVGLLGVGAPVAINASNQAMHAALIHNSATNTDLLREVKFFSEGNRVGLMFRF